MREAVTTVAAQFWHDAARAGFRAAPPRPVTEAAEALLPLRVVALDAVSPAAAGRWLRERGLAGGVGDDLAPCRGLLHAARGRGTVFVRRGDPDDERRLTVAHEVAHFLLHYLAPRRQLLDALGPSAEAVLDGEVAASPEQRLAAAMAGLRLGPHVHLLGAADEAAGEAEADDLAIELLAPTAMLRPLIGRDSAEVAAGFGLPAYAIRRRLREVRPREPDPFVAFLADRLRARRVVAT